MHISGDYQSGQWHWNNSESITEDVTYLSGNDRPSIYQGSGTSPQYLYVVWQAKKGLSPESSKQGNERPSVVCIREKHETGWLPMEIFVVENTSDRNPVVTAF